MSRRPRIARRALVAVLLMGALTACAPEGYSGGASSPQQAAPTGAMPTASASPSSSADASAGGSTGDEETPKVPTDCVAILSDAVLAQLAAFPVNDPALGIATGPQPDGSLVCVWRLPGADTTGLSTTISLMASKPASSMLDGLAVAGFACAPAEPGTRCEKTWKDPELPVMGGRTLYYRSGLLIDTKYSNLAPSGYTDSIVDHLFG